MALTFKVKKAYEPASSPSDWVHAFYLSCNDELAVHFNRGQHVHRWKQPNGKWSYGGWGGVPAVCCLYPKTAGALGDKLFELAQVWTFGGEFVHAFLYKIQPYIIVQPPQQPFGDCGVVTGCCTDAIPTTVFATITSGGAVNGSYALVYNGVDSRWEYNGAFGTIPAAGANVQFQCTFGNSFTLLTAGGIPPPPSSESCPPTFSVVFGPCDFTSAGGTANAIATVTS